MPFLRGSFTDRALFSIYPWSNDMRIFQSIRNYLQFGKATRKRLKVQNTTSHLRKRTKKLSQKTQGNQSWTAKWDAKSQAQNNRKTTSAHAFVIYKKRRGKSLDDIETTILFLITRQCAEKRKTMGRSKKPTTKWYHWYHSLVGRLMLERKSIATLKLVSHSRQLGDTGRIDWVEGLGGGGGKIKVRADLESKQSIWVSSRRFVMI